MRNELPSLSQREPITVSELAVRFAQEVQLLISLDSIKETAMHYLRKIFAAAMMAGLLLAATEANAQFLAAEEIPNPHRDGRSLDQGGDNATSAIIVPGLPFCDTGTTVGYANDYAPTCVSNLNGPDVVYRYTPTATSNVVFSFCGSSYENVCHVWNSVPSPTGAPFLCAHSNCGNSACASFSAVAGTTYYIVLDGQNGASGAYQLNANTGSTCQNTPCTALNDACADAILLPNNGLFAGTTAGATFDDVPYCNPNGQPAGPGVWYRVTGQGRQVTISVPAAAFPARLGLYCGDCTCLSCFNQTVDCATDTLQVCLSSDVTYYILVSSCDGSTGGFTLALTQQSSLCSPGITCLASLETPLTAPGSRSGNTCNECNDCALRASPEVVIPVEIPSDGWWVISLCQSTFNTYMYVGTAPCTANIYANNDTCGVQSSSPCLYLIARTYFVAIEGNAASDCGNYALDVFPCPPPANDACANAIEITIPGTFTGTTIGATLDDMPDPDCDSPVGPGVWYKFSGHDRVIVVDMTTYLTSQLSCFDNSCCGRLHCTYQGPCGQVQTLGICKTSAPCMQYVLISSCNAVGGAFTFTITEGNECQAICGVYEHVLTTPSEVSGTTCGKCNDCALGAGEDASAWFQAPVAGLYSISTSTDFPAMLYVGTDRCQQDVYASPECDLNQTTGAIFIPAGGHRITTIEPCDPEQCGNYTLTIEPVSAPPPNDDCDNAIEISIPATVNGYTFGGTIDNFPTNSSCDPAIGPGVWYKFTGHDRGTALQLVTNQTHMLTYFRRACCGRLECLYQGTCGQVQSVGTCVGSGPCQEYLLISACDAVGGGFTLTITEGSDCTPDPCFFPEHTGPVPFAFSGSSCGACNDCDLGPGEDAAARFIVDVVGTYTVTYTTDYPVMMYVGTSFCSQDLYASSGCALSQMVVGLNLTPAVYFVTLEPCNAQQCGSYTISMQAGGISPPQHLVIQRNSLTSVRLNWEPSLSPVTGYSIYRGTTPGVAPVPGNFLAMTPDTFYVDPFPVPGERFFYVVTAVAP
jgi:hypothetical protein